MCKEFGSFREDIAVVHASVALWLKCEFVSGTLSSLYVTHIPNSSLYGLQQSDNSYWNNYFLL